MKSKAKKGTKGVGQYTHGCKKRPNNPPVGLVDPKRDPDRPRKRYAHDPRIDPHLQWSGKAEGSVLKVDTVSLHVHERVDPHTMLEKAMRPAESRQEAISRYFDSPENNPPHSEAIEFYRHDQNWSNRMIAGDSLLVMNSLLEREGMEGKVQVVYMDPPYGIKYGSNFQPFVSKRSVTDGKDEDLTQEPEMIRAFRDTWELGIHSYLTHMRDRLLLARRLLRDSGSCIVQISSENLSRVRLVMEEIFGSKNFVSIITVQKTTSSTKKTIDSVADYLVWYAKDIGKIKYRNIYVRKGLPVDDSTYRHLELADGTRRPMTKDERSKPDTIPVGARIFSYGDLTSETGDSSIEFKFDGQVFTPGRRAWTTTLKGLGVLSAKKRIDRNGSSISYIRYFDDFPYRAINNVWTDAVSSFMKKTYVVQTNAKIVERVLLMTTDPGDLVLDPTCGSGTTAYAAEKWGRRWITCDTSRIALALARKRLMTASFDYFALLRPDEGVASGFDYNAVPRATLGSIAKGEDPPAEILYDDPKIDKSKARITGPFTVEAVPAPTAMSIDALYDGHGGDLPPTDGSTQQMWRDMLCDAGIRGRGGQRIEFSRVESHPGTGWIHADAETSGGSPKRAVVSFGPEHAPLEKRQVKIALEEACSMKEKPGMIIFAAMQFDPEAARMIDEKDLPGIAVLRVDMTKDLLTNDLKKKGPSSEPFWLMGQPDVKLSKAKGKKHVVAVRGFDYYNSRTGEIESGGASRIAMWMLDEDYDGRSLYPGQVFFPMDGKAGGWDRLARALKAQIDYDLVEKYRGTESIPFEARENKKAAVKIIDDRGIESLRIIELG